MSISKDFVNVKKMVDEILEMDEKARNSDSYLYYVVCGIMANKKGIDLTKISADTFLRDQKALGMPNYETVRRTRQKAQEMNPDVAADDNVQAYREMNEEAVEEIIKMCF